MADEFDQEIGDAIESGGGRFNLLLIAVFVVIAFIVGMTLVHSLWGSSAITTSQTATRQLDDNDAARDRARINELASYAAEPETHKQVLQLAPIQAQPRQTEGQ